VPRRDVVDSDGRSLHEAQIRRLREAVPRRNRDLLRHPAVPIRPVKTERRAELLVTAFTHAATSATATRIDDHLVADREPTSFRRLEDDTRGIAAGHERQRKRSLAAESDPDVEMIESAGLDIDQRIVGTWNRIRTILHTENFGPSVLFHPNGSHHSLRLLRSASVDE